MAQPTRYARLVDRVCDALEAAGPGMVPLADGTGTVLGYCPACRIGTLAIIVVDVDPPEISVDGCSIGCGPEHVAKAILMARYSDEDLDRVQRKPRPKGKLPHLPDEWDADTLRWWLTLAFCPPPGWRVETFERAGRQKGDPCSLTIANGRERETYRFKAQGELWGRMREIVLAACAPRLRMPHLTVGEIEDVWAALCGLGHVLDEQDELEQASEWLSQLVEATEPLGGYSLTREKRHDALMALKQRGEFSRLDALAVVRGNPWPRKPTPAGRFGHRRVWVRAGEAGTFLRYIVGVDPLPRSALRARFAEIGVRWHRFEDRRPPHPKLNFYRLPEGFET